MFDSLFGGGESAEDAFNDAMVGYEDMLLGYYQPFMDQTFSQLPMLEQQYAMLLTNPNAIWDMMGAGYESSPGYQYQMDQAMYGANSAASAGGMLGTPSHQTTAMTQANNIAAQDFDNYMTNMMSLYTQGLTGTSSLHNLNYTTGYKASTDMAGYMSDLQMAQAQMASKDAQAESDFWGEMMGIGLTVAGGALFGPAGSAAAAGVADAMNGGPKASAASATPGTSAGGMTANQGYAQMAQMLKNVLFPKNSIPKPY